MKKASILAAVLLIAVGLALCAGAFYAVGFDFTRFDTTAYEANTYPISETVQRIEIEGGEADIALAPFADGGVRVVCMEGEHVRYQVWTEAGTLRISEPGKRAWYTYLIPFSKDLRMTVYLPAGEYEALRINGRTGDVEIPDAFSFGSLAVRLSTGDIGIRGLHAGEMELSVSTGDISANAVVCDGDLAISVSTGDAELTEVTCRRFVSTGSTGSIKLADVVASEDLSIERSTGDVRFDDCDAAQIRVKTSTGSVRGTLRSEKTFVTKTSTGSVSVPENVSGGRCEITTTTGDIRITLA